MTPEAPRRRGRPRDPGADRRILDATRAVVADLGVAGASMSAIADRSGVGKPTIYLRWPDRPAVIQAAVDEVLEHATADVIAAVEAARDALAALAAHPDGRFLAEAVVMPRAEPVMGAAAAA